MNSKKFSRLFAAAIVLVFVFSLIIPCAAEVGSGSPNEFETEGASGAYEVDAVDIDEDFSNKDFPFEDMTGIIDRGDLSYNCTQPRLVDYADLLTEQEEKEMLKLLNKKSEELQFDFVVVFSDNLGNTDIIDYAQDYYDYSGYGFGDEHDGVIMVIDMADRNTAVSSTGMGEYAISEAAGIDFVIDAYIDYLGSEDFTSAIESFVESSEELVNSYLNGNGYDRYEDDNGNYFYGYYDDAEEYFSSEDAGFLGLGPGPALIISLGIGLLLAKIMVSSMKSKLKTVRKQSSASNYVVGGSMNVYRHEDRFLYANVSKVKIQSESNNSSGGFHGSGGGSHVGSSGTSHSSGSRHF